VIRTSRSVTLAFTYPPLTPFYVPERASWASLEWPRPCPYPARMKHPTKQSVPARALGHSHVSTPRDPEQTLLHRVIRENYPAFLEHAQDTHRIVPWFVRREIETYLRCGILRHGFLRLRCQNCGDERPVPFSCKGRSLCTSCSGRRMADTAAHWVDRVIPRVPTRQWVVSFPFALRYVLAHDHRLCSDVLRLFLQSIFASLRRRARSELRLVGPSRRLKCGAVTALQRFGDGLRLNLHFHSIVLDGVYELDSTSPTGSPLFHPLASPDNAEVARVLRNFARRLKDLLERRGLLASDGQHFEQNELAEEQPLLALLYGASIQSRVALGCRAGQRLQRIGDPIDLDAIDIGSTPRCASTSGLNLHANVSIPVNDRRRLERLARYILRPPFAQDRLSLLPDGRVLVRLKTPWKDGTHHLIFDPIDFIGKLAALVPPPRAHQIRYFGVFAPSYPWRDKIVGDLVGSTAPPDSLPKPAGPGSPSPGLRARRLSWAQLLRRVFRIDVQTCPRCGGTRRIIAAITDPNIADKILNAIGQARPPPA